MRHRRIWLLLSLCWLLVACGQAAEPETGTIVDPGLLARAVAEATTIAGQVQATAAMAQDRALVTALVGGRPAATTVIPGPSPTRAASATALPSASLPALPEEGSSGPTPPAAPAVEVLGVEVAAGGRLIAVRFLASPAEAAGWAAGSVSLIDEGSGAVYDRVPEVNGLGPLIGRPKREGQMGYVLLDNGPPALPPGAVVIVILGTHRFEHLTLQ